VKECQKCYPPCRIFSWRSNSHEDLSRKPLGNLLPHDSLLVIPLPFLTGEEVSLKIEKFSLFPTKLCLTSSTYLWSFTGLLPVILFNVHRLAPETPITVFLIIRMIRLIV
jgi:hypothetical protein